MTQLLFLIGEIGPKRYQRTPWQMWTTGGVAITALEAKSMSGEIGGIQKSTFKKIANGH